MILILKSILEISWIQKILILKKYIIKEFPIHNLKTLDNKTVCLIDLKGKPTLINFWFTGFKPCIEEIPVLNSSKSEFKDSVNFVAITDESTEKVRIVLRDHKFNFIQVVGVRKFIEDLSISTFPMNLFLDKMALLKKSPMEFHMFSTLT